MTCVLGAGNCSALLLIVDRSDVIVSELNEHEVAGLQTVIHLVPSSLIEEGASAASSLGTVDAGNLVLVEDGVCL